MRIHDYCAKYECHDENDGWVPTFDVCWCPDENYISEIDRKNKEIETVPRCCPKTKLAVVEGDDSELIACPLEEQKKEKKQCGSSFKEYSSFKYDNDNDNLAISLYFGDPNPKSYSINETGYEFCVGPTVNYQAESNHAESIHMKLFQCKLPCEGRHPCIR